MTRSYYAKGSMIEDFIAKSKDLDTQVKFASKAEINRETLNRIINQKAQASPKMLQNIATTMGILDYRLLIDQEKKGELIFHIRIRARSVAGMALAAIKASIVAILSSVGFEIIGDIDVSAGSVIYDFDIAGRDLSRLASLIEDGTIANVIDVHITSIPSDGDAPINVATEVGGRSIFIPRPNIFNEPPPDFRSFIEERIDILTRLPHSRNPVSGLMRPARRNQAMSGAFPVSTHVAIQLAKDALIATVFSDPPVRLYWSTFGRPSGYESAVFDSRIFSAADLVMRKRLRRIYPLPPN